MLLVPSKSRMVEITMASRNTNSKIEATQLQTNKRGVRGYALHCSRRPCIYSDAARCVILAFIVLGSVVKYQTVCHGETSWQRKVSFHYGRLVLCNVGSPLVGRG